MPMHILSRLWSSLCASSTESRLHLGWEQHTDATASTRTVCTLPPELLLYIFEQVARLDKDTIATCTLSSKAWRQLALPFFLDNVTIRVTPWHHRVERSFQVLLRSLPEHSNVAAQVKNLRLSETSELDYCTLLTVKPQLPSLRNLTLESAFLKTLPSVRAASVRSITIELVERKDVASFCEFLQAAGANVTTLDIWVPKLIEVERRLALSGDYIGPWSAFDDAVKACPKLQTVRIYIRPYTIRQSGEGDVPSRSEENSLQLFASIVDALPPTTCRLCVYLRMKEIGRIREIHMWDLFALDALSDKSSFPRFKHVWIKVTVSRWSESSSARKAVKKGVKACLPCLHRNKGLRYEWTKA
ncbi:hypothetical protein OH76DRAFT_1481293 [Lentinus brumalis]|uniref:F-box domain-containing protein n=1 Tax=Lentinus brumalis TaxID=2498619 RepID=A0A371DGX0_9APHY|nr:hypothetical protein OH76DRAFT_1481293 [Polyporus brumalis]